MRGRFLPQPIRKLAALAWEKVGTVTKLFRKNMQQFVRNSAAHHAETSKRAPTNGAPFFIA
jgi:hypothetical protein